MIDHLQRYFAVEEILDMESEPWNDIQCSDHYLEMESESELLSLNLRNEWNLGLDPIPNMTDLLEDQGFKVLVIPLPDKVSGLTCTVHRQRQARHVPVIIVNQGITLERRRLTLAHELAHRLLDEKSPVDHEKASNVFAGAFLVPNQHLFRAIGHSRNALGYKEIIQLKRMYGVSAAALLVRLKQLGIIDSSTLAYAFQTFARKWRKTEPMPIETSDSEGELELPRRFERLCYRALAEKLISLGKAAELLQQPASVIEEGLKGPSPEKCK